MNLIISIIVCIVIFLFGATMLTKGLDKYINSENDSPLVTLFWCLFAVVGFCLMPIAFLLGNYISLVLKPF